MPWKIETKCLQEGYKPENGQPRVLPIYQSTTYKYDSTEHVAKLFDLSVPGHMYSRISNPTVECVENKIAALEGGIGALCTSSGQAASLISILNICEAGEHFVCSGTIYGGTINLFGASLKKHGISVTFVDQDSSEEEIQKAFQPNTKALFGESIANPKISVLDIEKFAKIAHKNNVPLIIDNTFATPILLRPIEYGADIVVHSTTKYMDGHAVSIGGVIVDSGKFNWDNGKFPGLTEPDDTYHGMVYTRDCGKAAYITKARVQLIRDYGCYMSANNAFLLNLGLETLHLRIERHCRNAEKVAEYLSTSDKIMSVSYPTLAKDSYHSLAQKYLPKGCSGVVSFRIKGGREGAVKFMDKLKLAAIVVHVADCRTAVLHPASSTHRQLSDEQLVQAGIDPGLIRFSVGIENIKDIIEDIKQALED
ncbi:O-acetylhomoserine/O-acetylserine sulfhydrylase [Ruminiclostridium papyrosolvens DSM 2782]|uniref:O-acetylhomoserine/O-acetylserine sulfhydrylase n=1 Tax=Ruminiclostridium papyrosolvens DSM 2782 TaxID=588581 RepID=F1TAG4_9FIRM|nr:O-acetylhomoserine aminocarboxypropyltransferase/cysteine synthase family protein [Ruminiclostridium papyrosolvens]EGD48507.1 O-acetylhomoserine/O-acetylserine sulfhydrylase [Ruminiclostridium papyrosolvens DSM 2782]WES32735.1 O-acetylhomoserine aminocarboxypropyltransferase/cysteine synthase [Ruminiclostridium papyrosolvens DSM 2782]